MGFTVKCRHSFRSLFLAIVFYAMPEKKKSENKRLYVVVFDQFWIVYSMLLQSHPKFSQFMLNKEVFGFFCCCDSNANSVRMLQSYKQYKIYILFVLLYTEAYKFNGLVQHGYVNSFMDSTMFATISVKYTRRIALLAREEVPENQNKIKEGESEAKRKRKTFLI